MIDGQALFSLQIKRNSAVAIGLVASLIAVKHPSDSFIVLIFLAQFLLPGIVGGSRDTEESAHCIHFLCFLIVVDRPILRCASCTSRNSVWNFFSNATSIRRRSNSRTSCSALRGLPIGLLKAAIPSLR